MRHAITIFALCTVGFLDRAGAQSGRPVAGEYGDVYHTNGDTIWREVDSTMYRAISRRDTVIREVFQNGALYTRDVWALRGDSAALVSHRDSAGVLTTTPSTVPLQRVTVETVMLQHARMPRPGAPVPEPARLPADHVRYSVLHGVVLEQHRDTIWSIAVCPNLSRRDTTMFVLVGSDSVRRLGASPRTFGPGMVATLRFSMRSAMLRDAVVSIGRAPPPDVPRPCLPK